MKAAHSALEPARVACGKRTDSLDGKHHSLRARGGGKSARIRCGAGRVQGWAADLTIYTLLPLYGARSEVR